MADVPHSSDVPSLPWSALRLEPLPIAKAERLVRETWRHYYVTKLAEVQFGAESLEASLARSRALECYRELRGCLAELDPLYAGPTTPAAQSDAASAATRASHKVAAMNLAMNVRNTRSGPPRRPARHLRLVGDDPPE